jgi:glycosyltransferase involved in cell wall biosynthesis
MPRLWGCKVVVTIHALDWERPKWGWGARAYLKQTERSAIYLPHGTIAVSRALRGYFEGKYPRPVCYIPNGVAVVPPTPPQLIREAYGLAGGDYVLFLARLVPEKRVDWLIRAFLQASSSLRLVVAGEAEGDGGYGRVLHELAGGDGQVVFTGMVGGRLKEELLSNALLYVTPSAVEGLPIALLEAMAHSRCCLASSIPAHVEVIEDGCDGLLFPWDDFQAFAAVLEEGLNRAGGELQIMGERARQKVLTAYDWENVARATEAFYYELLEGAATGEEDGPP